LSVFLTLQLPLCALGPPHQGKLLATVNSKVHVFKWVPAGGSGGGSSSGAAELVSETSTPVQVLSLFLAAR
jgi:hypothetical protein